MAISLPPTGEKDLAILVFTSCLTVIEEGEQTTCGDQALCPLSRAYAREGPGRLRSDMVCAVHPLTSNTLFFWYMRYFLVYHLTYLSRRKPGSTHMARFLKEET